MGKRDDLIAQYADDLRNKCGMTPDMDLLTKVTIGRPESRQTSNSLRVWASMPLLASITITAASTAVSTR